MTVKNVMSKTSTFPSAWPHTWTSQLEHPWAVLHGCQPAMPAMPSFLGRKKKTKAQSWCWWWKWWGWWWWWWWWCTFWHTVFLGWCEKKSNCFFFFCKCLFLIGEDKRPILDWTNNYFWKTREDIPCIHIHIRPPNINMDKQPMMCFQVRWKLLLFFPVFFLVPVFRGVALIQRT